MSLDESRKSDWEKMQARHRPAPAEHLKGSGGGGTFDGMEGRVSKLEGEVASLRVEMAKGFGDVKSTLAAVDERTKQMATKWDVVLILGAMAALIGGVVALTARFLP